MKRGVSNRLAALRAAKGTAEKKQAKRTKTLVCAPEGWREEASGVYVRQTSYPAPTKVDRNILSLLIPGAQDFSLAYWDTETTGLSAGAGTVVFLTGIGKQKEDSFIVTQFLLGDYPFEPEYLEIIKKYLVEDKVWVSYNGKAFDANLMKTRFLLNRKQFALPNQWDLLYLARRLWRNTLPDCTMKTVEEQILKTPRTDDLSGAYAPELYFEYLKKRDPGILEPVFRHNCLDVYSLYNLAVHYQSMLRSPESISPRERRQMGLALAVRSKDRAEDLLHSAYQGGDEKAGEILALWYKRTGKVHEALCIWKRISESRKSIGVYLELAKYYEHRKQDFTAALQIVSKLLSFPFLTERIQREVEHRRKRLERKLDR